MKKKKLLLTAAILTLGTNAFAVDTNEAAKEKRWTLKTGVDHTERQSGRIGGRVYDDGYTGADDFYEDGDVTTMFTSLGYKINNKWSVDYKYSLKDIDNNEQFGKGNDKDSGQYRTHTIRTIRTFDKFNLLGKDWNSSVWTGLSYNEEPSVEGPNADGDQTYKYNGSTQKRVLFNANMNTALTAKTHLDLNFLYQFRDYNYDNASKIDSNQHREYFSVGLDHNFNDSWYITTVNTLQLRQYTAGEYRNYGEWDYNYTLGHKYPLVDGYVLNTELTAWGELSLWEKGSKQVQDHNQAEFVFMPKIKKTFELTDDMNISGFVGAGYVYGYDTRTNRKMYAGFEGRFGAVYSYNF